MIYKLEFIQKLIFPKSVIFSILCTYLHVENSVFSEKEVKCRPKKCCVLYFRSEKVM